MEREGGREGKGEILLMVERGWNFQGGRLVVWFGESGSGSGSETANVTIVGIFPVSVVIFWIQAYWHAVI